MITVANQQVHEPNPDLKRRLDSALAAYRDAIAEYAAEVMTESEFPASQSLGMTLRLTFGIAGLIQPELPDDTGLEHATDAYRGLLAGMAGGVMNTTHGIDPEYRTLIATDLGRYLRRLAEQMNAEDA